MSPFTGVVTGPTGSGKSKWVLRLIDHANEIIEPPPTRIWYCYGEFQPTFNTYPWVHFHEGLRELSGRVFDGLESTLIILDDLMSETNQMVANMFTKISHHRNVSVVYLTQNVFDKNKYENDQSQCTLPSSVQKPTRCQSVCHVGETDVTEYVKVCGRSIQGCYQWSVWLSADRPETRTRRAMSFENERISWRKSIVYLSRDK